MAATIKQRFLSASMLMKIIYINIAVFLILRLSAIVCVLFNVEASALQEFLALPASFSELAYRPWTALTYMFVHYDVMHILFNMLLLYWFGQIFLYSSTPKQLVVLYFYGGLAGGLLYILAYTFLPYFRGQSALLIGASASIMAIVVATAIRHHDYNLRLLFIGNVALKWIAIIAIAIDLLSLTDIRSSRPYRGRDYRSHLCARPQPRHRHHSPRQRRHRFYRQPLLTRQVGSKSAAA